jgi:Spy/CpxP family protein refolding chaperone
MRVAATAVPTAEVHMTAAVTATMAAASATMAAAAVTAASALADRGARQHCHQHHDGNSDCPVGHGSLLRHQADVAALE